MSIKAGCRSFLLCVSLLILTAFPVQARSVQQLRSGEFIYSEQRTIPDKGWQRQDLPFHDFFDVDKSVSQRRNTLWGRFQFRAAQSPEEPTALLMDYTTERFIVYLNGVEIFRNFSDPTARTFASFAPAIVPLTLEHMRAGNNVIDVRFESDSGWCLGVGHVSVGPEKLLRTTYDRQYLLQFLGPQVINGVIAALTLCAFLFWTRRRQERSFFWLTIVGVLWWIRNLHYSAVDPPIGPVLMWESTIYTLFGLISAFFGFTLTVFDVANRRKWIAFFVGLGGAMIALRFVLHWFGMSDLASYLFVVPMTLTLVVICARAVFDKLSVENIVMLLATTIAISFSFHDFGWLGNAWEGAGFQIQPYASLIVYSAFLFTIGRRFLGALDTVENMNQVLAQRIAEADSGLRASEAARRDLEISQAVSEERERLMMEIHDGIGSNLITALSAAERRQAAPETIAILRQSITDLKIAVDSLEPIEGSVVSLLANLRHRLEPELQRAGLSFDWRVMEAPDLPWLDAVGALHVLRILQEAISNILSHSDADTIIVECGPLQHDGREGISIIIRDEGRGFDPSLPTAGKGIANMTTRAKSLHGMLICKSGIGEGTAVRLWLPVEYLENIQSVEA